MKNTTQNSKFELLYSFFMLVFGVGIISCFIGVTIFAVYVYNFMFLIFCWPILVGIWMGLFKRSDKGYELELKSKDSKKLFSIIKKIQEQSDMKKPHKIIISEGSEVAVTGLFRKKLIIGLATLQLLDEKDILSIISHEYGHFANKDTVLGYFTYRIQNFIELQKEISKQNITLSFTLVIYLPTFLFFYILSKFFTLVNLWYSRRIEYRADEFASNIVGKQQFANSLVKYCMISEIFENVIPQHILHFLQQDRALINIYDYMKPIYTEDNLNKAFEGVLQGKSSWLSTHPSISERLEALDIDSTTIHINFKQQSMIDNQEEYEKLASEVMTHRMAYWAHLVSMVEQEED